jgi:hypothetical protein
MKNDYITQALAQDSAWLRIEDYPVPESFLRAEVVITKINEDGDLVCYYDVAKKCFCLISDGMEMKPQPTHFCYVDSIDLLFAEVRRLREELGVAVDAMRLGISFTDDFQMAEVLDKALKQIREIDDNS